MPGWSVIPAIRPDDSGGTSSDLKEYGQVNKLSQPDFYQKEQYKAAHEDEDMLPGQKMYYQERQGQLNQAEQSVRGEMYDYFSKSQNIPSATMQQTWNKKLYGIEQQRMKLNAEASEFRQGYVRAKGLENQLYEGGDKSIANRVALTYHNGTWVPVIGAKEEGGHGWLTPLEVVKGFDLAPGETPSGNPNHVGLDTPLKYTGDWSDFVNKEFTKTAKSKERTGIPQVDANGKVIYTPQVVSQVYGTENMQYLDVLTRSNNKGNLQDAAETMMDRVSDRSPAFLDLASQFYENLVHAQQTPDGTIYFNMDSMPNHQYAFNKTESGVVNKLLNMQKLDRNDTEQLNRMIKGYGKDLILSEIPGRTDTVDATEHIKVKDVGTGEGTATRGGFTQIATGKAQPDGPSKISYNEDGLPRTDAPGVFTDKHGNTLQLNRWEVPLSNITEFNNNAKNYLVNEGGILPDHFSKGWNFFYNEDGTPNSMAIFEGSGARVVGITGEVQENFILAAKAGKSGYDLDMTDVRKLPIQELKRRVLKTVGVQMAVPDNSDFFDNLRKISGLDIKAGVKKDDYPQREYYDEYSGGKKAGKKPYRIVTLYMPITSDDVLYQFENKEYAKGTQQAMEQKSKQQQQAKENYISNLSTEANLN